jgi:Zn-dependent protease with chaperone function
MAAPAANLAREAAREAAGEVRGLVRDVLGGGTPGAPGSPGANPGGLLDQLRGTVEDVTGVRAPNPAGQTGDGKSAPAAGSPADLRRPPQSQNARQTAPSSAGAPVAESPSVAAPPSDGQPGGARVATEGQAPASISVGIPTVTNPSAEARAPSDRPADNRPAESRRPDGRDSDRSHDDLKAEAGDLLNTLRGTVENATGVRAPKIPGLETDDRKPRGYEPPAGDRKPAATPPTDRGNGAAAPPQTGPENRGTENRGTDNRGAGPLGAVDGVLNAANRSAKVVDDFGQSFVKLSVEDEKRWGKKLHEKVLAKHEVVHSAATAERIRKLAAPLIANLLRPEIEYTFTVLKSDPDDLNAFSIPGGYVYLHSAVLDFVRADEELQFLLGHEIGHVDLEHCAKKLAYGARVSDLTAPQLGDAVGTLHHFLSRPYRQDEEYDADYYAFVALIDAGRTRDQTLACTRRFDEYLRKKSGEAAPDGKQPSPGLFSAVMNKAQDHFSTHPPYQERLRRLEAIDAEAIRQKSASARHDTAK